MASIMRASLSIMVGGNVLRVYGKCESDFYGLGYRLSTDFLRRVFVTAGIRRLAEEEVSKPLPGDNKFLQSFRLAGPELKPKQHFNGWARSGGVLSRRVAGAGGVSRSPGSCATGASLRSSPGHPFIQV